MVFSKLFLTLHCFWLQAVVNFMLDNFDHENACFLAERVHAESKSKLILTTRQIVSNVLAKVAFSFLRSEFILPITIILYFTVPEHLRTENACFEINNSCNEVFVSLCVFISVVAGIMVNINLSVQTFFLEKHQVQKFA